MENSEEQNVSFQLDSYLESPKAFHLEMPLYHTFDLSIGTIAEKVYELLTFSGTIDAYCIWCDDEKIKMVQDYLPEFLVENRSLYAILSKGIHD